MATPGLSFNPFGRSTDLYFFQTAANQAGVATDASVDQTAVSLSADAQDVTEEDLFAGIELAIKVCIEAGVQTETGPTFVDISTQTENEEEDEDLQSGELEGPAFVPDSPNQSEQLGSAPASVASQAQSTVGKKSRIWTVAENKIVKELGKNFNFRQSPKEVEKEFREYYAKAENQIEGRSCNAVIAKIKWFTIHKRKWAAWGRPVVANPKMKKRDKVQPKEKVALQAAPTTEGVPTKKRKYSSWTSEEVEKVQSFIQAFQLTTNDMPNLTTKLKEYFSNPQNAIPNRNTDDIRQKIKLIVKKQSRN